MRRLATYSLLVCATLTLGACNAADTAPPAPAGTPTPPPEPVYSNETYAQALKTVSLRLRGVNPPIAHTQDVLVNGRDAYVMYVDEYLDPSQNDDLGDSLRDFYRTMFMMGGTIDGVNYDEVPNLAAHLVLTDKPVTEILTAEYCVGNDFNPLGDCTNGAPAGQRAGVISNQAFLKKFGQADTVNMRRVSVTHQLFACGIYPDPDENPPPLVRTNTAESTWPINNNGTPDDATDDFPDPQLGAFQDDPAGPSPRLHKKYQTKLPSAAGARCHDCHGLLNARRPVFTFFDPDGVYNPVRSIGLATQSGGDAEDNVEAPSVNGNRDYCSAIGDTVDGGGDPDDDDMDNGQAWECSVQNPTAIYLGQEVANLRELGAAIVSHDRFYECMTTRHYNFALGKSQGDLSMQAAGGFGPPEPAPATHAKFLGVYESSGWNTRELWRNIFKSTEFLSSQGPALPQE